MREGGFEHYSNYFEDIANRNKAIKGFVAVDQEELSARTLAIKGSYPAMIAEYPDLPLSDNKANTVFNPISGITILKSVAKGRPDEKKQALMETERIMLAVISQIRKDRKEGKIFIDTNNLELNKIGPMWDNCFGWRMEFKYEHWVDLTYQEEEWAEYDPNKFTA